MVLIPWQEYWNSHRSVIAEALKQYRESDFGKVYLGDNPPYRRQTDRADRYCRVTMGPERAWGLGGRQHMLTLYYVLRPLLTPEEIIKVSIVEDGGKDYLVLGFSSDQALMDK